MSATIVASLDKHQRYGQRETTSVRNVILIGSVKCFIQYSAAMLNGYRMRVVLLSLLLLLLLLAVRPN